MRLLHVKFYDCPYSRVYSFPLLLIVRVLVRVISQASMSVIDSLLVCILINSRAFKANNKLIKSEQSAVSFANLRIFRTLERTILPSITVAKQCQQFGETRAFLL